MGNRLLIGAVLLVLSLLTLAQADLAYDDASLVAYAGGWTNDSNGGSGFGAWTLVSDPQSGFAGAFRTSDINTDLNGIGTGTTATNAWGLYANGSGYNQSVAYRGLTLNDSETFVITIENGTIQSGGSAGMCLRTGNVTTAVGDYNTGARFEFSFVGGSNNYYIFDSETYYDTGIGWQDTGLQLSLTLTSADTYNLMVVQLASGTTNFFLSRTLGGTSGGDIDSVSLFNRDTETDNVYFNSMAIIPEAGTFYMLLMGSSGLILAWIRRRFL